MPRDSPTAAEPPPYSPSTLSLPVPLIPVLHLKPLLPDKLVHQLAPFIIMDLGTQPGQLHNLFPPAPKHELPPWTRWHERWYRVFHPLVWALLEYDHIQDKKCLTNLKKQAKDALTAAATACEQEEEYVWRAVALHHRATVLAKRMKKRVLNLYALHTVRAAYLNKQHASWPGQNQKEILQRLSRGYGGQTALHEPGSVWPFTNLLPSDILEAANLPSTFRRSLNRLQCSEQTIFIPTRPFFLSDFVLKDEREYRRVLKRAVLATQSDETVVRDESRQLTR